MKKKFIKMNDGKNYLSLGNIINIIKKHSKVEASGIQKEVFCGVFNINDIKTDKGNLNFDGNNNPSKKSLE